MRTKTIGTLGLASALILLLGVLLACTPTQAIPIQLPTPTAQAAPPTLSPAALEMIKMAQAFEDTRNRGDTNAHIALVAAAKKEQFREHAEQWVGMGGWKEIKDCIVSDDRVVCKGVARGGALPCGISELHIASAEYWFRDGKIDMTRYSYEQDTYSAVYPFEKSFMEWTRKNRLELLHDMGRLTREGGALRVTLIKEYCAQATAQTTQFAQAAPAGAQVVKAFSKMDAACDGKTEWTVESARAAWIDVGIGWFAKDGKIAQENWKQVSLVITLDGKEIKDLEKYFHGPKPLKLDCPGSPISAEMVGLEIYVPPLPVGDHKVTWKTTIESDLNDGYDDYKKGSVFEFTGTIRVKP
jgi:hypothetical protein